MVDPLSCVLSFGLLCAGSSEPAPKPDAVASVDEFAGAPTSATEQGAASAVLAKVHGYYDRAADVQAAFAQTYVQPVYGTKTVWKGALRVKKPGKMVWDYADASNPDVWIDGTRVWMVEADTKQVVRNDLGDSDFAGAAKFLFGGRQLVDDFLVKMAEPKLTQRYGMPKHSVVRLKPRVKNPHFLELVLVVDDATGRVDAFVVLNADKSTNHFVLTEQKVNSGVTDAQMKFTKPKGYSEIAG